MLKQNQKMSIDEVIVLFDSLLFVIEEQMIGCWCGEGVDMDYDMDGMLESFYWYGKVFEGFNVVYFLVYKVLFWGCVFVNLVFLLIKFFIYLLLCDFLVFVLFLILVFLICIGKLKVCLCIVIFCGRLYVVMCYDVKLINDVFVFFGFDLVLGWMDFKGMEQFYFFKLYCEV